MEYDPQRAPEAKPWLALDEESRVRLCEAAHQTLPPWHPPMKSPRLHATIHTVVETQLAQGSPPQARAALDRLIAQGLTRHEAIHELGTVVSELIFDIVQKKKPFDAAAYAEALDSLRRKVDPNVV